MAQTPTINTQISKTNSKQHVIEGVDHKQQIMLSILHFAQDLLHCGNQSIPCQFPNTYGSVYSPCLLCFEYVVWLCLVCVHGSIDLEKKEVRQQQSDKV